MDLAQALTLVLIFPVVSVLLVVLTTLEMRLFGEPGRGRRGRAAAEGHVQPPLTPSSRATDVPAPDLDGVGREQPSPPGASGVPAAPQHELPSVTRPGRSRAVAPDSSRITRSRPWPHRASWPVPHDGQASRPPARSARAAAASAHSSTAGLPHHDGHDAGDWAPRARGNSCCSLPGRAASRNPDRPGPSANDTVSTAWTPPAPSWLA
jgi:hypothetical protein